MKDFQPIAIAKDEEAAKRFKSQVRIKRRYIDELHDYISKYVEVQDKVNLQGNFYDSFVTMFLDAYKDKFPPISLEKMFDQMDCDSKKIKELCDKIESIDIKLDAKMEAKEPDFNIYTNSENQNKLFVTLKRLCKDVNSLKEFGVRLSGNALIHGTQMMLVYNWSKQEMEPNTRRILGQDLRG
tara:strand:- start:448 stop:996 length:549 start_codon:yes stop_codon:yes gene_type:complete